VNSETRIVNREYQTRRLRNHASLALWCGNNENLTMWENSWGGKEHQPDRYYGENLYERVLPEVLRELDPDRPYLPTSPQGFAKRWATLTQSTT